MRKEQGMTQEDLGKILGVQKSAIQKYETNENLDLRASTIKLLCRTFNVFPYHFIYENTNEVWGQDSNAHTDNTEHKTPLQRLREIEENFGQRTYMGLLKISELNNTGAVRVIEYIEELLQIEKYRR